MSRVDRPTDAHPPHLGPAEQELTTFTDSRSGVTLRIRALPAADGHVRLEQLAYSPTAGWYRQKSFTIPRQLLEPVAESLRYARCLIPEATEETGDAPASFKFPRPAAEGDSPDSVNHSA